MGYIDPGLLGSIAQIGFALLFVLTSSLLFFPRKIKSWLTSRSSKQSGDPEATKESQDE